MVVCVHVRMKIFDEITAKILKVGNATDYQLAAGGPIPIHQIHPIWPTTVSQNKHQIIIIIKNFYNFSSAQ